MKSQADDVITVHSVHVGRKQCYAILYVAVLGQDGQIKRQKVRLGLGDTLGDVTHIPGDEMLSLESINPYQSNPYIELRLTRPGLKLYDNSFFIDHDHPVTRERIRQEVQEITRQSIEKAIQDGCRIPHQYLYEHPDMVEAYENSPGGRIDWQQDEKAMLRLRMFAGLPVTFQQVLPYPDLLAEFGGV